MALLPKVPPPPCLGTGCRGPSPGHGAVAAEAPGGGGALRAAPPLTRPLRAFLLLCVSFSLTDTETLPRARHSARCRGQRQRQTKHLPPRSSESRTGAQPRFADSHQRQGHGSEVCPPCEQGRPQETCPGSSSAAGALVVPTQRLFFPELHLEDTGLLRPVLSEGGRGCGASGNSRRLGAGRRRLISPAPGGRTRALPETRTLRSEAPPRDEGASAGSGHEDGQEESVDGEAGPVFWLLLGRPSRHVFGEP